MACPGWLVMGESANRHSAVTPGLGYSLPSWQGLTCSLLHYMLIECVPWYTVQLLGHTTKAKADLFLARMVSTFKHKTHKNLAWNCNQHLHYKNFSNIQKRWENFIMNPQLSAFSWRAVASILSYLFRLVLWLLLNYLKMNYRHYNALVCIFKNRDRYPCRKQDNNFRLNKIKTNNPRHCIYSL